MRGLNSCLLRLLLVLLGLALLFSCGGLALLYQVKFDAPKIWDESLVGLLGLGARLGQYYVLTAFGEALAQRLGIDPQVLGRAYATSAWLKEQTHGEGDVGPAILIVLTSGESAQCQNAGRCFAAQEMRNRGFGNDLKALEKFIKVWQEYDIRSDPNSHSAEYIGPDYDLESVKGSCGAGALGCSQFMAGTANIHYETIGPPFDLWDPDTAMKLMALELHRLGWNENQSVARKAQVLLGWNRAPGWVQGIASSAERMKQMGIYLGTNAAVSVVEAFGLPGLSGGWQDSVLGFLDLLGLGPSEEARQRSANIPIVYRSSLNIVQRSSPNKGGVRVTIDRIVIHWWGDCSLKDLEAVDKRFSDPASRVSAHYGVSGATIYQWVPEDEVSWHSGNSAMNARSIGIEHDACVGRDLSEESYQTSARLIAASASRHNLPLDRKHIIGHDEVIGGEEVGGTQCPGTIDIDRLIELAKVARELPSGSGTISINVPEDVPPGGEQRNVWKWAELNRSVSVAPGETYDFLRVNAASGGWTPYEVAAGIIGGGVCINASMLWELAQSDPRLEIVESHPHAPINGYPWYKRVVVGPSTCPETGKCGTNLVLRNVSSQTITIVWRREGDTLSVSIAEPPPTLAASGGPGIAGKHLGIVAQPDAIEFFRQNARPGDIIATHLGRELQVGDVGRTMLMTPSLAALKAQSGSVESFKCLGYNLEHWGDSPEAEKADPVSAVKAFNEFTREQRGKCVVLGPDMNFTESQGRAFAPYADIYVLQMQSVQDQEGRFQQVVRDYSGFLKAANPKVEVWLQVDVRKQGAKAPVTVPELVELLESVKDQVDGLWPFFGSETDSMKDFWTTVRPMDSGNRETGTPR